VAPVGAAYRCRETTRGKENSPITLRKLLVRRGRHCMASKQCHPACNSNTVRLSWHKEKLRQSEHFAIKFMIMKLRLLNAIGIVSQALICSLIVHIYRLFSSNSDFNLLSISSCICVGVILYLLVSSYKLLGRAEKSILILLLCWYGLNIISSTLDLAFVEIRKSQSLTLENIYIYVAASQVAASLLTYLLVMYNYVKNVNYSTRTLGLSVVIMAININAVVWSNMTYHM
jgi:hypothetical protein